MNLSKWTCALAVLLVLASAGAVLAAEAQPTNSVNDVYPGLASMALKQARLTDLPAGVILRCGEIIIRQPQVDARLKLFPEQIRGKVKLDQFYLLEDTVAESLLYSEAYEWAMKNKKDQSEMGAMIAGYLDTVAKNVAVTDEEIKQFYEDNKDEMAGMALDEVRKDINNALLDGKRLEAANTYIASLSEKYDIEVDRTWAGKQYPIVANNLIEKARKAGKPLFVDFGSESCGPCKRLAPILGELKKEYAGKAEILIIDVDKEPVLGSRYGATAIPTQIFYDRTGKQVFRHTGYYPKASLVAKLAEIGAK